MATIFSRPQCVKPYSQGTPGTVASNTTILLIKPNGPLFNLCRIRFGHNLTHRGRHKMAAIFQTIFSNEFSWMKNVWISIRISLKFVPMGPINNIPALVQIMAWRRPSSKPLSEPMMVNLLAHISVLRPQWVKQEHRFRQSFIVIINKWYL